MFCSQFDSNSFALISWTVISAWKWCLNWAIPQKKHKRGEGGWGHTFMKNSLELFICFKAGNSRQNKSAALEISQIFVRFLGSVKAKNQDLWKFHIIFSGKRLEIALRFSLIPGNSTFHFDSPGNSISSTPTTPPCLVFFWNCPLCGYSFDILI